MRAAVISLLLLVLPGIAQKTGPTRADLQAVEKNLDNSLIRFSVNNPYDLLGQSRGVYVDGNGAIFSAEISLISTPGLSPFRPALSQEEKQKIQKAKLERVPALKQLMRDFLVASASSLDRLPPEEQVAVGISLFYHGWEIQTGLPQQVVMWGPKRPLVDIATGRAPKSQLDSIVKVREF